MHSGTWVSHNGVAKLGCRALVPRGGVAGFCHGGVMVFLHLCWRGGDRTYRKCMANTTKLASSSTFVPVQLQMESFPGLGPHKRRWGIDRARHSGAVMTRGMSSHHLAPGTHSPQLCYYISSGVPRCDYWKEFR